MIAGSDEQRRFLTIANAATYCDLSSKSIRRALAKGELTPFRPARGRIVVDVRELESWVLGATSTPRNSRGRFLAAEAVDRAKRKRSRSEK